MNHRTARRLLLVPLVLLAIELLYVMGGTWLLRVRLSSVGARAGVDVTHTGVWTLYPGDLRAERLVMGDAGGLDAPRVIAEHLRGGFGVAALLGGSLEVGWLDVQALKLRVQLSSPMTWLTARATEPEWATLTVSDGKIRTLMASKTTGLSFTEASAALRSLRIGEVHLRGNGKLRAVPSVGKHGAAVMMLKGEVTNATIASSSGAGLRGAHAIVEVTVRHDASSRLRWKVSHGVLQVAVPGGRADVGGVFGLAGTIKLRDPRIIGELTVPEGDAAWLTLIVEGTALDVGVPVAFLAPQGALLRGVLARAAFRFGPGRDAVHGSVSLRSTDAELRGSVLGARLELELQSEVNVPSGDGTPVLLGPGEARLTRPSQGEIPSLDLRLALSRASWLEAGELQLSGAVECSGGDAGELLDLMHADPGVRWMLAELEQEPFTLEAALAVRAANVALERIEFNAATIHANGAVYRTVQAVRGALLVHRGKLRAGVLLDTASTALRISPKADWLSNTLSTITQSPEQDRPEG